MAAGSLTSECSDHNYKINDPFKHTVSHCYVKILLIMNIFIVHVYNTITSSIISLISDQWQVVSIIFITCTGILLFILIIFAYFLYKKHLNTRNQQPILILDDLP